MTLPDTRPHPTIAILGGGLSGAATAFHLARIDRLARIVVIEPRPQLGAGLAYSTPDPDHRLNVPDHKMTLRGDRLDDYAHWLRRPGAPAIPPDAQTPLGVFTSRQSFGAYVADLLAPLLATGRIQHLRAQATRVAAHRDGHLIVLSDGSELVADRLVLALSHPKPALLPALRPLQGSTAFNPDPMAPGALAALGQTGDLVIVGAGLTAADVAATLLKRSFSGQITLLSRHGWRSKQHGPTQATSAADFSTAPSTSALALLQRVRRAVHDDAALGLTWHASFDRLRAQGPAIWAALPLTERRRLLRHLRSLWDIHRFRIAPQTEAAVQALAARGQLHHVAGRVVATDLADAGVRLTLRRRGAKGLQTLQADHVILATGPNHASVIADTPVLASLSEAGLIAADPTRLGIATAPDGRAIPARPGLADYRIFVAGPLARGTVGELMGVPEVILWAEHVAASVAASLAGGPACTAAR